MIHTFKSSSTFMNASAAISTAFKELPDGANVVSMTAFKIVGYWMITIKYE